MSIEIITVEHCAHAEILTAQAKSVEFPLSQSVQSLITDIKQKLIESKAVGIAAPQVGAPIQLIVYQIDDDARSIRQNAFESVPLTVLINPKYHPHEEATIEYDWEGCLSVSDLTGKVPRFSQIYYSGLNERGEKVEGIAKGFTARVLQHEIDHIQGILIIDRLHNESIKGHPKDMAKCRIREMNAEQRANMKVLIKKIMENHKENSHYGPILEYLLELEQKE